MPSHPPCPAPAPSISGASGGGLFAERSGELILLGVTSTVAGDLSSNGLVRIATVRQLLADPDTYLSALTDVGHGTSTTTIERS